MDFVQAEKLFAFDGHFGSSHSISPFRLSGSATRQNEDAELCRFFFVQIWCNFCGGGKIVKVSKLVHDVSRPQFHFKFEAWGLSQNERRYLLVLASMRSAGPGEAGRVLPTSNFRPRVSNYRWDKASNKFVIVIGVASGSFIFPHQHVEVAKVCVRWAHVCNSSPRDQVSD